MSALEDALPGAVVFTEEEMQFLARLITRTKKQVVDRYPERGKLIYGLSIIFLMADCVRESNADTFAHIVNVSFEEHEVPFRLVKVH